MTLHTFHGTVRNLFIFHSTVVKSCDMGMFLLLSAGSKNEALELLDMKKDGCEKMLGLYFTEQSPWMGSSLIGWVWLLDAWVNYLLFHLEACDYVNLVLSHSENRKLECIYSFGDF